MAFDTYLKITAPMSTARPPPTSIETVDRDLLVLLGRLEPDDRRLRRARASPPARSRSRASTS